MKYFLAFFIFLTNQIVYSQFTDDFSDNDFTSTPSWIGDDTVFMVVDVAGNKQLRSNKTIASTSFYLTTPNALATDAQWEFYTNLQFPTSSANFVDIYLAADQSNLFSGTMNGYFVRIGGTTDEISLYKKLGGVATELIDGIDAMTNTSNNTIKIKVTRSASNDWELKRDLSGTGLTYFSEGIFNDASLLTSSFFGFAITQSTATFFQKHFFDDIYVGPIIYDLDPPILLSASAIGANQVDVVFNEPLSLTSAQTIINYGLLPSIVISTAVLDLLDPTLVHLTLASAMINGTLYTLNTNAISDLPGNIAGNQSVQFSYIVSENPLPGDVILSEFVCDQSPVVGLPEVEYVEIFNNSSKYFDLQNWKLGDASSDGTIQQAWLFPGEYKILCSTSNIDTFTMTTAVGVTSFPSLNNAGDDIVLKDINGIVLDKISYSDSWYQDPLKEEGGYSIELINPNDPCSAADNWKASIDVSGGTPGAINSVYDITSDTQMPSIEQLVALSPNYLEIYFSEGMDSTLLANAIISSSPLLTVQNTFILGPFPTMMTLQFAENLTGSQLYSILLENIGDCWMNSTNLNAVFALPEIASIGDVVINEILFDPYTGGYDWIEVYNNSQKLIDLKDWQLANYDNDTISNNKTILEHFYLGADEYAVIGKDSTFVLQNYPAAIPGTFVYSETPSFNVDSSTVYLINNFQVMDKVSYTNDWHFQLLDVTDGVSLERMDPSGESNDQNNWHSAAEAIGFATPGGKNSQYYPAVSNGEFSFTSSTISPDNDGFEDILSINYQMSEPSLLGKFTIYDDRGRLIRDLFNNELLASSGMFSWDGVTNDEVKASIGTYVAVFEAFSLDGGLMFTKTKAFVVAGKL